MGRDNARWYKQPAAHSCSQSVTASSLAKSPSNLCPVRRVVYVEALLNFLYSFLQPLHGCRQMHDTPLMMIYRCDLIQSFCLLERFGIQRKWTNVDADRSPRVILRRSDRHAVSIYHSPLTFTFNKFFQMSTTYVMYSSDLLNWLSDLYRTSYFCLIQFFVNYIFGLVQYID